MQGGLQLCRHGLGFGDGSLRNEAGARDRGERLPEPVVGVAELAGALAEQADRAKGLLAQPERNGVYRGESGVEGGRPEGVPALFGAQVGHADRLLGAKGGDAGPVVHPQLDELELLCRLGGGRGRGQLTVRPGEQHSGRIGVEQRGRTPHQQVDITCFVEQSIMNVGQLDKRRSELCFVVHEVPLTAGLGGRFFVLVRTVYPLPVASKTLAVHVHLLWVRKRRNWAWMFTQVAWT